MRRILHLSDLHFGRSDETLEKPLLAAITRTAPDLVVISGDFTQRARPGQFARAQAFLQKIDRPWLAVPGNHDTPLDNLLMRLARPFARYRHFIARDLEPIHEDAQMRVVGVNSVNPWSWQQGHFRERALKRVCDAFADAGDRLRVVALHHPLEQVENAGKSPTRGAARALRGLADCGADVILSGHLHRAGSAPFRAEPGLLFVQAGTGLSTRRRGETNTFNLLDVSGDGLRVTEWAADWTGQGEVRFAPGRGTSFRRKNAGWTRNTGPVDLFGAGQGSSAPVAFRDAPESFPTRK